MKIANLIKNIKEHIGIRALATGSFIILILLALAYLTLSSYTEKTILPISSMSGWRTGNMSMMTAFIPLIIGLLVLFSSILLLSSNTTVRGSVLSLNLIASIILVAGIFSPWINCAGMTGSRIEQGMTSVSQTVTVNESGCKGDTDPDYNNIQGGVGSVVQQHKTANITFQYTVEDTGYVSVCAIYSKANYDQMDQTKVKSKVEFHGSLNKNTSGPDIDDPILFDETGESLFPLFGGAAGGICGADGHLVTDSLDAMNATYILAKTNCNNPITPVSLNPKKQYDVNKEIYNK